MLDPCRCEARIGSVIWKICEHCILKACALAFLSGFDGFLLSQPPLWVEAFGREMNG